MRSPHFLNPTEQDFDTCLWTKPKSVSLGFFDNVGQVWAITRSFTKGLLGILCLVMWICKSCVIQHFGANRATSCRSSMRECAGAGQFWEWASVLSGVEQENIDTPTLEKLSSCCPLSSLACTWFTKVSQKSLTQLIWRWVWDTSRLISFKTWPCYWCTALLWGGSFTRTLLE